MYIRTLEAYEIEVRAQSVNKTGTGCMALLYKDARCDMRILDEVFGVTGWQRTHEIINGNLFCNVSIWDKDKGQWVVKQDVGTESMADKEKGQASDSFKRACFNVGIGRELYTSPFIWIKIDKSETYETQRGLGIKTKFHVSIINYNENREVSGLEIKDDKGKVRYTFGDLNKKKVGKVKGQALEELAKRKGADIEGMEKYYGSSFSDMEIEVYAHAVRALEKREDVEG